MNLYFACSLTGGRKDERIYARIVGHLLELGHEVPTAHLADPSVMEEEKVVAPEVVYQRDVQWIQACDALIAEVSTPSHGVGYEIGYALSLDKPVLCCFRYGAPVSKMITGNDSPRLSILPYSSTPEALSGIDAYLDEFKSGKVAPPGSPGM